MPVDAGRAADDRGRAAPVGAEARRRSRCRCSRAGPRSRAGTGRRSRPPAAPSSRSSTGPPRRDQELILEDRSCGRWRTGSGRPPARRRRRTAPAATAAATAAEAAPPNRRHAGRRPAAARRAPPPRPVAAGRPPPPGASTAASAARAAGPPPKRRRTVRAAPKPAPPLPWRLTRGAKARRLNVGGGGCLPTGIEKLIPQRSSWRSWLAKLTGRSSSSIRSPSASRMKRSGNAASIAALAAGKVVDRVVDVAVDVVGGEGEVLGRRTA